MNGQRDARTAYAWRRALCLVAAAIALAGSGVHAAEGQAAAPCLGGVCVGDDLRNLLDLRWHDVALPAAVASASRTAARISVALRGEPEVVEHVLRHWPNRWFDGPALRALASLDAVCEDLGVWLRPRAAFTSPEGLRVVVSLAPVAAAETGPQHFEVATLAVDAEGAAAQDLRREFESRYDGFATYPTYAEPGVRWHADGSAVSLKLFAPIRDSFEHARDLRLQPNCSHAPVAASQPASSAP